METRRADAATPAPSVDDGHVVIEGVEVVPFATVVSRLCVDYPSVSVTRIETILMREWEAFTAGRPLVVPAALEGGVREMLDER
ncbi:hypothetical protein DEU34_1735 [Microbacterium sp. AG1240]|uniref:hypothetical protein n=1 Tax=Microbacterium sp. AG1240 TaxID=2183992 RepID=UPI000EB3A5B4|nr:hypothetical protein [Microbacterium sp. AG1240]RKT33145.1 hypothetical protein DEU34_1735 [Microbacterium sp. AG1240]